MKILSGKNSICVLVAFAALGLVFALLFTPGGRQRWLLPRGQRWKDANRQRIDSILADHPGVGMFLSTDCRFHLLGKVGSAEQRQRLLQQLAELDPPLEIADGIRVLVEALDGTDAATLTDGAEENTSSPLITERELAARDARLKHLLDCFDRAGIRLRLSKSPGDYDWAHVDPPHADYHVRVHFSVFPEGTSEADMRWSLRPYPLAHIVNDRAHIAMSCPGLRGRRPDVQLPAWEEVEVVGQLIRLFREYDPRADGR